MREPPIVVLTVKVNQIFAPLAEPPVLNSLTIPNRTAFQEQPDPMRRLFVILIPFFFVFLWSTGFIAAKYALPYIEPFFLLLIRLILTILAFGMLCLIMRAERLTLIQACHQIVAGLMIHGTYLGGVFAAIKWGMPAGIAAIVVGVQPVLTAAVGRFWLGESLRQRQWLGLLLGLAGVTTVLLSGNRPQTFELSWPATLAAIIALVGISLGTIYQKRFGKNVNLLAGSLYQYTGAAVLMAILAGMFETGYVDWQLPLILALGWLVLGISVTAILLLMYMIREGETSRVVSYFYLVPPVAAIEAWLLFDEALSAMAVGAMVVTVLGVYLATKKSRP